VQKKENKDEGKFTEKRWGKKKKELTAAGRERGGGSQVWGVKFAENNLLNVYQVIY